MTLRNYFRLLAEDQPSVKGWAWFWKPLLRAASFFYFWAVTLHRSLYQWRILKRKSFSQPVVSVGNLVWGGTGKTPLVEYLAHYYLSRGKKPLILARGYGQDESKELARKLPEARFGIGKNRLREAEKSLAAGPADVVLLDDGFQHWGIKRDADIVVINALNPFGNGSLIPCGTLREPAAGLKRASVILVNDVNLVPRRALEDLKAKVERAAPAAGIVLAFHEPLYFYRPHSRERIYPERMQGERVTSFSGIGAPRSFQLLLKQIGVRTIRNFEFCDHHAFTEDELREILQTKQTSESDEIVTTEKDFYRCEEAMQRIVKPLVLKVRLHLTDGEGAFQRYLNDLAADSRRQSAGGQSANASVADGQHA